VGQDVTDVSAAEVAAEDVWLAVAVAVAPELA
jgi:hypothetical protein